MLHTYGYKYTLRLRNTRCFSTATVVVRTCLSATLYVRCLSSCFCAHYTRTCMWFAENTALIYVRKLNVMSVFKRPFNQNTEMVIFESRGDACLGYTTRLVRVAVLTFVNSRCILYVLLPAVLPSRRLSVTMMIRNMSVIIKFLSCSASSVWEMRIACSQFHFGRFVCSLGNNFASDMNYCRLLAEAELQSFVIWALHVVVNGNRHGMAASCPEIHSTVTIGLKDEWRDEKNLLLLGIRSKSLRT
jgi:hypothetical protein